MRGLLARVSLKLSSDVMVKPYAFPDRLPLDQM